MEKLQPKLFSVMKGYNSQQFMKDVVSGVIVAIIALPLSIALALASGVGPEEGLYTAIVAGFVISFLGGSRVQIAGPTAAFASIVAGIVAANGMDGLIIATVLAGILLILMGLLRLGSLVKFIPYTITTGFTFGIAVTIIIGQIKDFLGLTFQSSPVETMEKLEAVVESIATWNPLALGIGVLSLAILILFPKLPGFFQKIPPALVAVVFAGAVVEISGIGVNTIGDLYTISSALPSLTIPAVSWSKIVQVFPDALTIAVLAAVESLLSCVVADGMIGDRHRSNTELVAQGAGNICSALFGGIPATGAIARTAANIKNGGRTPVAGMVHSVVLLVILVLMMPYAALIPMPTIAAILFMVAYNMSGWRECLRLVKGAPKSDTIVFLVTCILTIVFDLVVAIVAGFLLAAILFMKRMAEETEVSGWTYLSEELSDTDNINLKEVPKHTLVYEVSGPMFFGMADKLSNLIFDRSKDVLILRMQKVPAMDVTALRGMKTLYEACRKSKVRLILSHVNAQPMRVMEKSGFIDLIGQENICGHIDEALDAAKNHPKKK